ncbi:sensor histidine kinase [Nevskia soli]|uniref:sensor histidine kinase n=1 Tax=Nevskia soli TaxID=418856 RepID=UPI0015D9623E|nr:ATP-binding protein [Nevskia soli]
MTLQARLTLWSMLVMASIVTIVSLSDLASAVNRQFDSALEHGQEILKFVPTLVSKEAKFVKAANGVSTIEHSPVLDRMLSHLAVSSHNVDQIVVSDPSGRVVADSYASLLDQPYTPRADFTAFVNGQPWWRKYWALYHTRDPFEISAIQRDPETNAETDVIHVILLPSAIRTMVAPILHQHAWVAIFSVVFAVLAAFVFAIIAFHPLGKLGKMLDMVAGGQYELQQVSSGNTPDEFGIVASKVSMLGQQLRGAQTEFSDLKGNFERLLGEMEDAVLIFGRDRRLIAAAGGVESYLDRPRVELVGLTVSDVFPPGTSMGLLLSQSMQIGRPIQNRAVPLNLEKDGGGHLRIALVSVEFLADSGMLIRMRDPEATRQIGKQLQTADRLSAISRLTSGVAHEVKNPLNAILMHVELAKLKLAHGDYDVTPQMDVLTSEILRLDRVVKTFLDFTRPVQLNLVETDLHDFVEELADLARPQASASNITLEVESPKQPVTITIDPDLFKQAVLNIVVNAIEAMPEGGTLRFSATARGDQAELRISDSGPGIPDDVRDKIYNLYFTTKEKGSGIGLSMTFRIVQLHDGTIDFESEPGHGTTFVMKLPVTLSTDLAQAV